MKTLLILLAISLIAAGVAVGLMNIYSPGTVIVGLNLDVAATLFTGGCVLLGLGVVAGSLSAMNARGADDGSADDHAPAASTKTDLPDFMAPAPVAVVGTAAAAAAAAAADSAAFGDAPGDTADATADVADDVEKDAVAVVEEAADSVFSSVSETASEAADDAADTTEQAADKARGDLSSFFAKAPEDDPDPDADTPPVFTATPDGSAAAEIAAAKDAKPETKDIEEGAGTSNVNIFSGSSGKTATEAAAAKADATTTNTAKTDSVEKNTATSETTTSDGPKIKDFAVETPAVETQGSQADAVETDAAETATATATDDAESATEDAAEALPQEDELFVVEERVIRERPARLLSDGTVEAETDEGWMRFENVEHVEEYLDAMKATA